MFFFHKMITETQRFINFPQYFCMCSLAWTKIIATFSQDLVTLQCLVKIENQSDLVTSEFNLKFDISNHQYLKPVFNVESFCIFCFITTTFVYKTYPEKNNHYLCVSHRSQLGASEKRSDEKFWSGARNDVGVEM